MSTNDTSELFRRREDVGEEVTVALATKLAAKSFMGCDWSMARENSCWLVQLEILPLTSPFIPKYNKHLTFPFNGNTLRRLRAEGRKANGKKSCLGLVFRSAIFPALSFGSRSDLCRVVGGLIVTEAKKESNLKKDLLINKTNLERKRLPKIKPHVAISSSNDTPDAPHCAPEWLGSLQFTLHQTNKQMFQKAYPCFSRRIQPYYKLDII